MTMRRRSAFHAAAVLVGALGLLGACKPTPVTTLEGRACSARPVLDGASPVELDGRTKKVVLDGNAACWHQDGGAASAYVVFRLPQATEPYILTIVSEPVGDGLLPPRVQLLDANGAVLRQVARDSFLSESRALKVGLRARPDERFLIVASDSDAVGQDTTQLTNLSPAGAFDTGLQRKQTRTYAHNGAILVRAEPLPAPR